MKKIFSRGFLYILLSLGLIFSCSDEEEIISTITNVQTEESDPDPIQYTLTVTAGEGGTVSSEGGAYDEGTEVTIIATPNEGYVFAGWEGSDTENNSIIITLNSNINISASFEEIETFDLKLRSEFANEINATVITKGIFAIWWDKNFEHDHLSESEFSFSKLEAIRDLSLNQLEMFEPPNVEEGYFLNIYIHHENDIFPEWWGNGVGTNSYGLPYMTTGHEGLIDEANIFHEGFHLYQYKQNSPGFVYSGDSMWYTEATAQWVAFVNQPDLINSIVEAGALVLNPQLALWHSFSNRAPGDIVTWLYEVRQYALHGLLFYLTEIEGVIDNIITSGFSAGTEMLPQEYLYNNIGSEDFRVFFGNWAAANTSNLSYLTREQVARAYQEVDVLIEIGITSDEYKNEFAIEIDGDNPIGNYSPDEQLRPRSWAYNVIKITNSAGNSYNINFKGEEFGSEGANSFFEVRIVKKSDQTNYSTVNFEIQNGLDGNQVVTLNENENEFYIVVASVPEHFTGNQNYNYTITFSD